MGYLERIDPSGWTAMQVSNFMEKIHLCGNVYQLTDLLDQTDSLCVCKGIIMQLVKENQSLQKQKRRMSNGKEAN